MRSDQPASLLALLEHEGRWGQAAVIHSLLAGDTRVQRHQQGITAALKHLGLRRQLPSYLAGLAARPTPGRASFIPIHARLKSASYCVRLAAMSMSLNLGCPQKPCAADITKLLRVVFAAAEWMQEEEFEAAWRLSQWSSDDLGLPVGPIELAGGFNGTIYKCLKVKPPCVAAGLLTLPIPIREGFMPQPAMPVLLM